MGYLWRHNMDGMFGASAFNQDIGAHLRVTTMDYMFHAPRPLTETLVIGTPRRVGMPSTRTSVVGTVHASRRAMFFRPDVQSRHWPLTRTSEMCHDFNHDERHGRMAPNGASAFDQDLGWCVDDDGYEPDDPGGKAVTMRVDVVLLALQSAPGLCPHRRRPTPRRRRVASLAPRHGPTPTPTGSITGYVMTNSNIKYGRRCVARGRDSAESAPTATSPLGTHRG